MRVLLGRWRWKRRTTCAVAALIFMVVLFAVALSASRPRANSGIVVRDRPVEHWIEALLRSNDGEAADAIREAGTNAIPLLRVELARRSSAANTLWVKTWPNLPPFLQNRFQKPVLARDARMNTVALLREIPEQSKTILSDLFARLQDEDAQIRLHTAITLGNIGPEAKEAIPTLLEFTRSTTHVMRVYSANALWKVSREVEPALSVLEAGLKEKGAKFRWVTPYYLGEMGTNAVRSVPQLVEASDDNDKIVASLALQALAEISAEAVPVFLKHLESNDPAMRISAAAALGKLGPKAVEAVPALKGLLTDEASGEPSIMGRSIGREKVRDAARSALQRIQRE